MKWFYISVLVLFILIVRTPSTHAAESSFSVSPPFQTVHARNMATVTLPFQLTNNSNQAVTIQPSLIEFKDAGRSDGSITYITHPDTQYSHLFSLSSFMQIGKKIQLITLQPGQYQNVSLDIDIDKNTASQDYYFSALFTAQPENTLPSSNSSSIVQSSLASPILFSYKTTSQPNDIELQMIDSPAFYFSGPFYISGTVENAGSTFHAVTGSIDLFTLLGQHVDHIQLQNKAILANSKRFISNSDQLETIRGNSTFLLGPYRLTIQLKTDNHITIQKTRYFFALPLPYVIALVLISFFGAGIYLKVKRMYKRTEKSSTS